MPLVIIYGDGSRERRLVPIIAGKLGFRKEYVEPQIPGGTTGLEATISVIVVILTRKASPHHYLIVIDQEHVPGEHTVKEQLARHGFTLTSMETIHPNHAWKAVCKHGAKTVSIYLTTLGTKQAPHIEGNLSKLIHLTHNEHVEPRKEAIRKWLKERNLTNKELVEQAPKNAIQEAFKPLAETLNTITREDP